MTYWNVKTYLVYLMSAHIIQGSQVLTSPCILNFRRKALEVLIFDMRSLQILIFTLLSLSHTYTNTHARKHRSQIFHKETKSVITMLFSVQVVQYLILRLANNGIDYTTR